MGETDSGVGHLTVEEFQALLEQTSDVVTIVAEDGTIKYQSPNSEHVKGWPPADLLGENILDFVHPEDRETVIEEFAGLTTGDGSIDTEIEFRFRQKDGEYIWLAVTGTAPDESIPIDGYVTTSRDISKRKAYEQELIEQRDDLETLNEVLRHDIRNDLQLIASYAEILEDHVDDEGQEHLETISQSADNAVSLTASARDLSKVLLNADPPVQAVSLPAILTDELDTIRSTYPETDLSVDGGIPEMEVLAGELLSSVFRNILKNAIQHNDTETPEITVRVESVDSTVQIRVADNGPGVRDKIKDEIFGKGEKGLESAGTGIGLYLVRSLVESYGGAVWVEDNEPRGAIFVVELDAADSA